MAVAQPFRDCDKKLDTTLLPGYKIGKEPHEERAGIMPSLPSTFRLFLAKTSDK